MSLVDLIKAMSTVSEHTIYPSCLLQSASVPLINSGLKSNSRKTLHGKKLLLLILF